MKTLYLYFKKNKHIIIIGYTTKAFGLLILWLFLNCSYSFTKESNPIFDFAKQQIAQKSYYAAISTLNTYLESNPKDKDAIYWKAYCFYKEGNYVAAEENYATVLKLDSKYLPAYIDMANLNVKQKKFSEAIPFFNKAINLKDSSSDLVNSRGMCYYNADKIELAIKDFRRAILLDPKNYLAYNNKGCASYNNQNIAAASMLDLQTAEKDFNKSLEIKPDFELAYRNRGVVRFYMDKLQDAYKDLLRATNIEPKDENAHYYLGKLLDKQKNYTIALQFFDNAISLVNYKAEFYIDRGNCKMNMENFQGAKNDFYQALQLTNDKGIIYYYIARAEAASANKGACFQSLRDAKKAGLFNDVKYFGLINKDKYYANWLKDKEFNDLMKELKFGKNKF